MNSCLYECEVMHRRLLPKVHQFTYRIFMFSLDLDELDTLSRKVPGFSRNRWDLYAFHDTDHLAPDRRPVKEKVVDYVQTQGIVLPPDVRVQLVTLPRVLGYIFNPVSFFFFRDSQDAPLCAVVEVGNTFREMKLFFLGAMSDGQTFRLNTAKDFYVSPFSSLDTHFDFQLRLPDDRLQININDEHEGKLTLVSTLRGRRTELSTPRLAWVTLKYPLITLKVITLIHWHALRLWLKRVPFFLKTDHPEAQKDVLRPHSSLAAKP